VDVRTGRPNSGFLSLTIAVLLGAACNARPAPTQASPEVMATTPSPTAVQALSGSATAGGALPIQFVPWPEQGDLLLPPDIEVSFETSLDDLSPGGYLLIWESGTRPGQIQAVSFPGREVTVLASVQGTNLTGGLDQDNFAGYTYVSPVAEPEHKLDVFELREGRTWRLGPLCDVIFGNLSLSGEYFLSPCDPSCPACANDFTPGIPPDFKVFEVISVTDGTGFRVALPSKDERDPAQVSWFDERELLATNVWIDGRFAVCLLDVEAQSAQCPYSFEEPYAMYNDTVTGEYLPFELAPGGVIYARIMPRACLTEGECEGIVDLGELPGALRLSPSGSAMLLDGDILSDRGQWDTVAAFLEPPLWEAEPLMNIAGSYTFETWCPDESCVFVSKAETPFPVYRLDRDGSLTFYPYEDIIASFNVP